MVFDYIYHIAEFPQVNYELGQATHGCEFAIYYLLAVPES